MMIQDHKWSSAIDLGKHDYKSSHAIMYDHASYHVFKYGHINPHLSPLWIATCYFDKQHTTTTVRSFSRFEAPKVTEEGTRRMQHIEETLFWQALGLACQSHSKHLQRVCRLHDRVSCDILRQQQQ